jgi:GNAT superfamily N-acetyltransferase
MILRKATLAEIPAAWSILRQAIELRKQDGSEQWQNGYPNEQTVRDDIGNGYVLLDGDVIVAYAAISFDPEPAYNKITGRWLTTSAYVVVHRVATSNAAKGRGIATLLLKKVEDLALEHNVSSIKLDTNFDNIPMLKILDRLHYTYCGEIFFSGASRKAYEKVLVRP